MAVRLELSVNGSTGSRARYLTWSPLGAELRVVDRDNEPPTLDVVVRNAATGVGQMVFRADHGDPPSDELKLTLPTDGTPLPFFLAGLFGSPSLDDRDAQLEVVDPTGTVLTSFDLMVRIRKNAVRLTPGERDRFLLALATLNDQGNGDYQDFRDTHVDESRREAHGRDGFLPWHRAYVLDFERSLQAIDPAVALPYWKFDEAAPSLFTRQFMGAPGTVADFAPTNPLAVWSVDGRPLIDRTPRFPVNQLRVSSELAITGADVPYGTMRQPFEDGIHGDAHTRFSGAISSIPTAARDPLFFVLHCNVDRIWAMWQWAWQRADVTSTDTYRFLGAAGDVGATRIGHNLLDSMWPWNGVTGGLRPLTAPRPDFPAAPAAPAPVGAPDVAAMIDYQDLHGPGTGVLGFDYDDVRYQP